MSEAFVTDTETVDETEVTAGAFVEVAEERIVELPLCDSDPVSWPMVKVATPVVVISSEPFVFVYVRPVTGYIEEPETE